MRTCSSLITLVALLSVPALAQFPVVIDFENGGSIPPGWTNDAGDSGEDWLFQIPSGTSSNPCSYGATEDHTADPGQYVAHTVIVTNLAVLVMRSMIPCLGSQEPGLFYNVFFVG